MIDARYLSFPHFICFGIDVEGLYRRFHTLTGNAIAASNLVLAHVNAEQHTTTELLNTAQAAERLGISREQVSVLCKQGRIRHSRVGKLIKIRPDDLDQYLRPVEDHW